MTQVPTAEAPYAECDQATLITLAAMNMLEQECQTAQSIADLIAHIRNCDACKHTLRFIMSDAAENGPTFSSGRDMRLDIALQEETAE